MALVNNLVKKNDLSLKHGTKMSLRGKKQC